MNQSYSNYMLKVMSSYETIFRKRFGTDSFEIRSYEKLIFFDYARESREIKHKLKFSPVAGEGDAMNSPLNRPKSAATGRLRQIHSNMVDEFRDKSLIR